MSTQKNEQYHILSPEWLKTNPLPEDAESRFKFDPDEWSSSSYSGRIPDKLAVEGFEYRTRRADLPPEAYITPPTDTTGSGRDGETPETDAVETTRIALGQPRTPAYGDMMACSKRIERQRDAALAQVAALRRDGERLDWLDSPDGSIQPVMYYLRTQGQKGTVVTYRQALDAAIDSAQRKEAE